MSEKKDLRFLLDDEKKAETFVYRPPNSCSPKAQNATLGVKFACARFILDEWFLLGGTKWQRTIFRLKHPGVYSKRGLRHLYRKIKRIFVKDRIIQTKRKEKR